VPTFLEKFVLPLFTATVILLVWTNPMGFDTTQRITGAAAIIFAAFFVAHTLHKKPDSKSAPMPVVPSEPADIKKQMGTKVEHPRAPITKRSSPQKKDEKLETPPQVTQESRADKSLNTPSQQSTPAVRVNPGGKWISTDDVVYGPDGGAIENSGEIDSKRLQVNPKNTVNPPVTHDSLALDQLANFDRETAFMIQDSQVAEWSARVTPYLRDNVDNDLATKFAAELTLRGKRHLLHEGIQLLMNRIHSN